MMDGYKISFLVYESIHKFHVQRVAVSKMPNLTICLYPYHGMKKPSPKQANAEMHNKLKGNHFIEGYERPLGIRGTGGTTFSSSSSSSSSSSGSISGLPSSDATSRIS